ncbi:uncharacterized protein MAM_06622 [Metarhizium album ARSEF 1941]|uniref:Uncharacterized protein n=1 Tax=Metarhizium album (strain ARSEF 1941) TaxID=1081103 RepID=A0A0B2WRF8_METAS|nr:uncharacterized protein MAM_06622 [Metarhizium album ARSEF 1941]KHN95565.1 hypothetical protein MAM_06622 [Metarhizium album ARSEF 1941]
MPRRPVRRGSKPLGGSTPQNTTPSSSAATALPSSAYSSTCPSEVEADNVNQLQIASLTLDTPLVPFRRKIREPEKPFRFLELPSELRVKVYEHYWSNADQVLDLEPGNHKRYRKALGLARACKQVHAEVTHFFFSSRAVRIFPTFPGKYFKSKKPLLARLKPCQRGCITALELRLGPGWTGPPRGWVVNDALGLKDCSNLRKLTVYVECDPSDCIYDGFRRSDGFYEGFCSKLLGNVLSEIPSHVAIEFEGYPGVKKSGAMMRGLLEVASQSGRQILWGPERGWTDGPDKDEAERNKERAAQLFDTVLMEGYAPHHGMLVVA